MDAGEVIDLFAAAGLEEARLDILSDDFLSRVSALEQKNLALETLRKLLADQIESAERTNLVQARSFARRWKTRCSATRIRQMTTAEMIARYLDLAKQLREAKQHGDELGLSIEETAFYDALAENGSAKDVMKSDMLRLMARELTEMVKGCQSSIGRNANPFGRTSAATCVACWQSTAIRRICRRMPRSWF